MANLDRVLGAIISNVARGRSQGDAAVVELAKMYLADDVLKSFPIPRMSLDEVVIELRVGISAMAQPGFTAEARQLLLERLDNTLHSLPERETALRDVMGREGAPARTLWQSQRASRLEAVARMLPEGSDINIERVSSAIGTLAKESVMTVLSDQRIVPTASRGRESSERLATAFGSRAASEAKVALAEAVKAASQSPSNLDVLVTANELQNVPPDKVSTIRMVLRESDREWTQLESDGKTVNRLIPR